MPKNSVPLPWSLDHYREKGKSNEDIAHLVAMIDKLQIQLNKTLDAYAAELEKSKSLEAT